MRKHKQYAVFVQSYCKPSFFKTAMLFVRNREKIRIAENCSRSFKTDLMLIEIAFGFSNIPFKIVTHILESITKNKKALDDERNFKPDAVQFGLISKPCFL